MLQGSSIDPKVKQLIFVHFLHCYKSLTLHVESDALAFLDDVYGPVLHDAQGDSVSVVVQSFYHGIAVAERALGVFKLDGLF